MNFQDRLTALGYVLPHPPNPAGNYLPYVRAGHFLYTAGVLPMRDGALACKGKLGAGVSLEEGYEAAKWCALNLLSIVVLAAGSLDQVERFLTITGYVNTVPDFTAHPKVINGASDLLAAVFGEAGKHARAAVGVASLPLDAAVEIQAVVLLKS